MLVKHIPIISLCFFSYLQQESKPDAEKTAHPLWHLHQPVPRAWFKNGGSSSIGEHMGAGVQIKYR